MAQLVSTDDIESFRLELAEAGRSMRSSFRIPSSSYVRSSSGNSKIEEKDDEIELQWLAVERLPTFERLRSSLFDQQDADDGGEGRGKRVVDVTKLGAVERHMFIEKLIKHLENDNRLLLQKLRKRIDKVGVKLPSVEVRYKNVCVEAVCQVVDGKPLPTLWNTAKSFFSGLARWSGATYEDAKINIIKDVNGIIKPSRKVELVIEVPAAVL